MPRRDPLANPEPLIRRVYGYAAYRLGAGPEAEDVTSDVFERALRYRDSYDPHRGEPVAWLLGIARRCVDDALRTRDVTSYFEETEAASPEDLEAAAVDRVSVARAIERLDARGRDLIALRYGADLSARQIGAVVGLKPNAVDVALHRTLGRLRQLLETDDDERVARRPDAATEPSG
jgi:RNA polymerase sigma-70 factor (ECF subfamily)